MDVTAAIDEGAASAFVSTGELPPTERVQALLVETHERYRADGEGATSDVYPGLTRVPPALFGICVAGVGGNLTAAGDADVPFTIMSVAKPFVYALVCRELGREELRRRVGVNATGLPFNSLAAVEHSPDGRTNPMVNAGAIAVTSLAPGADAGERWRFVHEGLSRFAGHALELDEEMYASASATNHRNQALARLLQSYGRLGSDPAEAVDLYTRQSCLAVSARDLALMGATLANGGVNPVTHDRVVDAESCHCTLAVMTTAGLYETSGDWLYDIGLPGKSGIGGGIVTVAPGKGGLGSFAPLLDAPATASRGSSQPRSCPAGWGSTSSRRSPGRERQASRAAPGGAARRAGPGAGRARRPGPGAGPRRALRARRADRRRRAGLRPDRAVPADRRRPPVRRADRRPARALGQRPGGGRAEGLGPRRRALPVPPRLPGQRARPRLRLPALAEAARRTVTGPRSTRTSSRRPGHPGKLALQYWLFYVFNDWNNLHEGDWEVAQLVFDAATPAQALQRSPVEVGYSQHEGAEGSSWDDDEARARRRDASGGAPGRRLARELLRRGALPGRVRLAGRGLRRHPGPDDRPASAGRDDPEQRRPGRRGVPLDRLRGALGRAAPGVLQRARGAEPEDLLDAADHLVRGLAERRLHGAGRVGAAGRGRRGSSAPSSAAARARWCGSSTGRSSSA